MDKIKIEVVIPVVQYQLAIPLLKQIDGNTLVPSRVIVVDNGGGTPSWPVLNNTKLFILRSSTGRLNESWEVARAELQPDTDFVTFMNDDIVIGSWFFQRVVETFEASKKHVIVCPNTLQTEQKKGIVHSPEDVRKGRVVYGTHCRKLFEPAAFTIKKEVLDQVPPVPWERITTFYGDNWVWAHVMRVGHCWGKDYGNNIYHYVGQTVLERGFRNIKKSEFNEWNKIRHETWGYVSYEDRRK